MNNRYFSWLLVVGVLVSTQPLAGQVPTVPAPPATGASDARISAFPVVPQPTPIQQPTGTFFYSDLDPATTTVTAPVTAPTPQPVVQPIPPMPAGTFFYSDLQVPASLADSPNQAETPEQGPLAPQPAPLTPQPETIEPVVDLKQPFPPTNLAPYPTNLPPVIPSRFETIGPRRTITAQGPQYFDPPAILTTTSRLLNQDPVASPSDNQLTPAQKGCSKWCRTWNIWGEFLYLRSRDSEVTYGVETNTSVAPPAPPVQVGRVGMIDQTHDPGFRFGVTYRLDETSSLTGSWAMLESHRTDRIERTSFSNVIESMVLHPTTVAASSNGTFATGIHDIDFDLVDLEYRGQLSSSEVSDTNFVVGLRYVNLQQQFLHDTDIIGSQSVATDIDFNGLGVRLGLEGERFRHKSRFFFYGKTYVNFIPGEFNAKFDQGQAFDASVVDTLWEAGRIVSIWDLELGLGHVCKSERLSMSVGYSFSAWTNVVKTDEFINAVQTNNFLDLGETMTYDGLVARLEGRF